MARTQPTVKCHAVYAVGKKLQEKKARQASSTKVMMSSDTSVEPPFDVDPVQEAETPKTLSARAFCLQLKSTERKRSFANFSVKLRIWRTSSSEGSIRSSTTYRLIDLLESHLGKRSIAQLWKTTEGLLITVSNTEGAPNRQRVSNKATLDHDQCIQIKASFPVVVRRWVIKKAMTA